jgi:2-amino-4-hydroxy-6-hydroxymethyldihydropteridine diphosphokinase
LEKVYLSLGSNIGDSIGNLILAIQCIDQGVNRVTGISPAYRTDPWGKTDQNSFFNCAVEIETIHNPWELKSSLVEIEERLGKKIKETWGERTIDIDIIFYGQKIIYEKKLIIPHPRFHLRNFVLIPLCHISENIIDPITGMTVSDILKNSNDTGQVVFDIAL